MKVVVIGGNAAGMSAASRIKRKAPDTQVVVLEKTSIVSYGACGMPYYVAGLNNDINLMRIRSVEDFEKNGICVKLEHTITQVDSASKTVHGISNGENFTESYDKLVVASGASPRIPAIPSANMDGVFVLKTLEDAQKLKKAVERGGNVVIVGGGYIGLELAEACILQKMASVTVIEAAEHLLNTFDDEFGMAAEKELITHGVAVCTSETLKEIKTDKNAGKLVVTNKGEYPADIVVLCIGIVPNTNFLQGAKKMDNGAIVVDAAMQTSLEDIFAAGDCATVWHKLLDKPVYLPLGTNANKHGRLVGDSILGKKISFKRALGTSMLRVMHMEFAATGLTEKEALLAGIKYKTTTVKAQSHARYFPAPCTITIKLVYRKSDSVLLGAQIMGEKESALRIDIFACAIDREMTTDEVGFLDLGYAPPFASVWDAVQIAANASK